MDEMTERVDRFLTDVRKMQEEADKAMPITDASVAAALSGMGEWPIPPSPPPWTEAARQRADAAALRRFATGAIRDTEEGKLAYGGFLSPLVLQRFATYMDKHRELPDGSRRGADNWKAGMPFRVYFESLLRHLMDLWFHVDRLPDRARDQDLEEILCALLFNVQGMLLERLLDRAERPEEP